MRRQLERWSGIPRGRGTVASRQSEAKRSGRKSVAQKGGAAKR